MRDPMFWILDGHTPVPTNDINAYAEFWKDEENRRVGKDYVGDILISTVFLCVDHGWGGGPPVLFESMVFGSEDEELQDYQERYCTWDEAVEGHKRIVEWVKKKVT
jgi:hypothetical protein